MIANFNQLDKNTATKMRQLTEKTLNRTLQFHTVMWLVCVKD